MHIPGVPGQVHDLVIAQYKVHISASCFGALFKCIDQPQAFRDLVSSVKKVTVQHQVIFFERPVIVVINDFVGFQKFGECPEVPLYVRDDQQFFRFFKNAGLRLMICFQPEMDGAGFTGLHLKSYIGFSGKAFLEYVSAVYIAGDNGVILMANVRPILLAGYERRMEMLPDTSGVLMIVLAGFNG